MNNRFANLFSLTEAEAIALLDTPPEQLGEEDSRYIAAAQLVNFPSQASIQALMRAVRVAEDSLNNRITRRKAVESLGRLKIAEALPMIRDCLGERDGYLVENSVWAIGEIGTAYPEAVAGETLEAIAQLLDRPEQTYRVIIQTLAKFNYVPALDRIRKFMTAADKTIASAAAATICRLNGDFATIQTVLDCLQDENVYARRLCIQDLMDVEYDAAIPQIATCPVSLVFRLRGIRHLAEGAIATGKQTFAEIQAPLEAVIYDHPRSLSLVHEYDQPPSLEFAINELYETDFGRCYLATKALLDLALESALELDRERVGEMLLKTYHERAVEDYGGHYNVIKLLGWLRYAPGYDLVVESLNHPQPQFQKSRAAAAIALGEYGDRSAIPPLKACLETKLWDLKYAALLSLEKLGETSGRAIALQDQDWLVRTKAQALM